MASALTSAVKGNVKASNELPFAMTSLSSGSIDQQFGGFVRVARPYADQTERGELGPRQQDSEIGAETPGDESPTSG